MKKYCCELRGVSSQKAVEWVKIRDPKEATPDLIKKYGGRSCLPFREWCFADLLLLMSNEKVAKHSQYVIDKKVERFFSIRGEKPSNNNEGISFQI